MRPLLTPMMLLLGLASPLTAVAGGYELGPGDVITIEVYGQAGMARKTRVPANCQVDVHLIGPVEACGQTTETLSGLITRKLADGYLTNPVVLVDIAEYGSQTVEFTGEVREPGLVALNGPTSLSDALADAGGPSSPSVLEGTVLTHDGKKIEFYIPELHDGEPIWLNGGDVVQLREPLQVFVTGEVENPGAVAFRQGITFTEALTLTGGPTEFAAVRRALIVRADGSKLRLNVRKIAEGREADVSLRADDRIILKQSLF